MKLQPFFHFSVSDDLDFKLSYSESNDGKFGQLHIRVKNYGNNKKIDYDKFNKKYLTKELMQALDLERSIIQEELKSLPSIPQINRRMLGFKVIEGHQKTQIEPLEAYLSILHKLDNSQINFTFLRR